MANSTDEQLSWSFDNSYARLPDVLHAHVEPAKFPQPELCLVNRELARELGLELDGISDTVLAELFSGQHLPPGSLPIAQAYAGHQFGGFTMLGDGRAILLGELCTSSGERWDIQFKGSGVTPFSRRGDGKAALGPMLREYIISEGMHGLGIPTTRSLAVVTTGEPVYRESVLQGAVLTRVAASHIRVGTFQYLAARRDKENLQLLADYTIERHFPDINDEHEGSDKYLAFFRAVMERQASLVSQWQMVGFVHGVMNTDNMALCGETIDYGPCAFMDTFHQETVFSSIDHGGRYAYGNQPQIAQWNLARFAETLIPLLAPDQDAAIEIATEAIGDYPELFEQFWLTGMRQKLGLQSASANDAELVTELLTWMQSSERDFTNTFDDLSRSELKGGSYTEEAFQTWHQHWQQRLSDEGRSLAAAQQQMLQVNPTVIPRNHQVEQALEAAIAGDIAPTIALVDVLQDPFDRTRVSAEFREPPPPGTCYRTFCGT